MSLKGSGVAIAIALSIASVLGFAPAAQAVEAGEADDATPVASVALVFPLTVPVSDPAVVYVEPATAPSAPTLIDAPTLEYYTSPSGILSVELDAIIDRPVTIAVDPLILASIRALGSDVPPSAQAWLDRLTTATNETFALGFADSDLTAPLQAGRRIILAPKSLEFALNPARFATTPPPEPAPSAPELPGAPPLPTTDQLMSFNYTMQNVAWPRPNTVVSRDLKVLADNGRQTTILASDNVTRIAPSSAAASIRARSAIVADENVSALLATALYAGSPSAWETTIEAMNRSISRTASLSDAASMVLTFDRDSALPLERLGATIDAVLDLDSVNPVGLGFVTNTLPSEATLVEKPQPEERVATTKRLLRQESADASFATVAENPDLITGERRIRILNTFSPVSARQPSGWETSTALFLAESDALTTSVALARSGDINFLANSVPIRPAVRNNLDQPIAVYLEVRTLDPKLRVQDSRVELALAPRSQGITPVSIQAVSNGRATLAITLTTTSGVQIGEVEYVTVNVQAGWEGPFTLIASILVVLVFAFGIIRTVLRRRAERSSTGD